MGYNSWWCWLFLDCKNHFLKSIRLRNQDVCLTIPQTRVGGCYQLALQNVMHKSSFRDGLQFFHTHTKLSSDFFFNAVTSILQRNNNRSGANYVRTTFTVYVGLLCLIGDAYLVMGVHCLISLHWLACALHSCINVLPKWKGLLCVYFALSVS